MKVDQNAVRNAKKASEILRLAADELHQRGSGECVGCCAVFMKFEDVAGFGSYAYKTVNRARRLFKSMYSPYEFSQGINDNGGKRTYWFGQPNIRNKHHRINALLMTAAMAESVGE